MPLSQIEFSLVRPKIHERCPIPSGLRAVEVVVTLQGVNSLNDWAVTAEIRGSLGNPTPLTPSSADTLRGNVPLNGLLTTPPGPDDDNYIVDIFAKKLVGTQIGELSATFSAWEDTSSSSSSSSDSSSSDSSDCSSSDSSSSDSSDCSSSDSSSSDSSNSFPVRGGKSPVKAQRKSTAPVKGAPKATAKAAVKTKVKAPSKAKGTKAGGKK